MRAAVARNHDGSLPPSRRSQEVSTIPGGFRLAEYLPGFQAEAWFGMLATALNLLPFGQLDGGHITYATLGRWSVPISLVTVGSAVVMTAFVSGSWFVMALVMVAMLFMLGPRHPRVLDEQEPLGSERYAIAVFALVMLILCFTPVPAQLQDLVGGR